VNKEKAIDLLSMGVRPGQVASILGVSPGRISQLLAIPEVSKSCMEEKQLLASTENRENEVILAKESAVKHNLLNALSERSGEASFMELARSYEIIARCESLRKNNIPMAGTQVFNGQVIQVALPLQALSSFRELEVQQTSEKEIIAIENRELAPMSAQNVTALFSSLRAGKAGGQNECTSLQRSPA
jgi:hypothetical protein